MKTLERYLHENMDREVIDFAVRARNLGNGRMGFYIHPDSRDGETLDFVVTGNALDTLTPTKPLQADHDGFGFGFALDILKNGGKVARAGWNGKGMFLFLVPGGTFTVNRPPLLGIYPEGTEINYCPHIDMRTADGKIVPWLASQTDMLATDWVLVERAS